MYDNTVFGSAKDGLLLTADAVYWRNTGGEAGQVNYTEIENVAVVEGKGIFGAPKILLNEERIELGNDSGSDANTKAQSLANVIRYLIGRRKSAGG